ncbi:MAG: DNA alkylation repair protein [Fidelibacterota bacterium]|nr:MAG: DNA alkylation repair protein [Candidatus Neomarinimicrobiota bacterium]
MTSAAEIVDLLRSRGTQENLAGMARYGIRTDRSFGVKAADIKDLARQHKRNHALALDLWATGYREARILAAYIADPKAFTPQLMDAWVADFDSWDICDTTTNQLFRYHPHAYDKALEWSRSERLFTRRAGFALMAGLALKTSKLEDNAYQPFFQRIQTVATDQRNMVKKAVNWALRQIGKRNKVLNTRAITVAEEIAALDNPAARWIASDALRELRSEAVQKRFRQSAVV